MFDWVLNTPLIFLIKIKKKSMSSTAVYYVELSLFGKSLI